MKKWIQETDTMEALEAIGGRVRNARLRKRLTQTELGRLVGYSLPAISSIERGKTNPKFLVLRKLADVLGLSLYEMVMSPKPVDDEASAHYFWKFLKSENTSFRFKKSPEGASMEAILEKVVEVQHERK